MSQALTEKDAVVGTFAPSLASAIQEIFGVSSLDRKAVYAGFYSTYYRFVIGELSKRNKLTQNFDDLCARMWVDFSGSTGKNIGLIEKFFSQADMSAPELPPELTGVEVAKHLNITHEEWVAAYAARNLDPRGARKIAMPLFPKPTEGSYKDAEAVYSTSDIEAWFEDFDRMRHLVPGLRADAWSFQLPKPKATKKHFVNYLKRCIANRWANFCRYESRRHRERIWDTFPDQRSSLEDPEPWEDRQEVPSNQEEDAEVALLVSKLKKTPAANHLKSIFLAVYDEKCSLKDAISRCEEMTAEEKRTTIHMVFNRRTRPYAISARAVAAA